MEITDGLICYRILYQSTTRENIEPLVCDVIPVIPIDVIPAIANKLLTTVYSRIKIIASARFKVGDSIRVSKYKTLFEKGYTPNWTEVFKITSVEN